MLPIRIEHLDDPRVALFAGVRDPVLIRKHRLFVGEGRLVVERLLGDPRYQIHSVLLNDASFEALQSRLEALAPAVPVFLCETRAFEGITGFNMHRGCLALAARPRPLPVAAAVGEGRLVVVLEGVTDADNVGAVFRNAAAFGVGGVLLSATCCDPLYRKAIRTSMGASLRIPFCRVVHWDRGLDFLRDRGFRLVALTPTASLSLSEFCQGPRPERLALLVGTEGAGLSAHTLSGADTAVRIPTTAAVDSLNLAVATGIALSRLRD